MSNFESGQDPFANASSPGIPAGVDPFASGGGQPTPQQPTRQPASVLKRALAGIADPGVGIAQVADKLFVNPIRQLVSPGASSMDDYVREREQGLQAEGLDVARMAGNVASPINYIGGGTPTLARSIATGAAQGAMQPTTDPNFWTEKAQQAALGGGIGAGGHALARTLGGIVRPTAEAKQLMDSGVALTPGQAAGVGSFTKRTEDALASLPIASHVIRNAQRRGVEEANVGAARSVANMIDQSVKLGKSPREAIEQTRDLIGKTYDDALAGMSAPTDVVRHQLVGKFPEIVADNPMMTKQAFAHMRQYVDNRFNTLWNNGVEHLDGSQLKQIDSEIGAQVRRLQTSTNASDKTAVGAWKDLQQEVREAMAVGATSPEQAAILTTANSAYRQLLALEKALLPGADTFSPRRLSAALDRANISEGPLRDYSNAMTKTLPNVVPDSGTAERLLTAGLPAMLGLGGAGASSMGYDTLGAGMVAAGALGSRPGARFMTGASQIPFTNYGWQAPAEALVHALRRGAAPATVSLTRSPQDE